MIDRLSVVDDIFLRTHRGYGLPIILQGIWRSDEIVDVVDFAAVHANLALGHLGRRVVTPRIRGARRRWRPCTDALPLAYEPDPIADVDVLDWADAQGDVDLDPELGPGWRMSLVHTDSGGTVMSLVCSHALADAAGLVRAAGAAFDGRAPRPAPSKSTSDLADALSLAARVSVASIRATAGLIYTRSARRELGAYRSAARSLKKHDVHISSAVFDIDATLSNSEFISVVARVAAALGESEPVTVNVPFRSKIKGSNRIGMATVEVSAADTALQIKSATKAAFGRPAGAPSGFPAEAVQLMSDEKAASLTASPGTARVLCSNIGPIPAALESIAGRRARSLATRAIHPGAEGKTTATALSAYVSRTEATTTLSLVATEKQYAPILADRAATVLEGCAFEYKSW
ncbi:hypothetical protein [Rhodococcus sp. P1Y]|uniref:hypothetical protein n=1 Tax=Rhodococcus sp. P1Y TaxID=1302308 RepID=UPI000EB398A6|nr:hypothetical protein [Rhodococcus sp. P1Y]AYJ48679.1 hypothetical protein D8W71_10435 [Rhodococcus sp. P1Y]